MARRNAESKFVLEVMLRQVEIWQARLIHLSGSQSVFMIIFLSQISVDINISCEVPSKTVFYISLFRKVCL